VEEAKEEALDQLGVDESDAEFDIVETPKGGLFGRLRSEARVRARVLPTAPRAKLERGDRRRRRKTSGDGDDSRGPKGPASGDGPAADRPGPRADRAPRSRSGSGRGDRGPASNKTQESPAAAEGTSGGREPRPRRNPTSTAAGGRGKSNARAEEEPTQKGAVVNEVDDIDVAEAAEVFLGDFLELFGAKYSLERRQLDEDTVEIAVTGDGLGVLIGERGSTLGALQELTRTVVQRQAPGHRGRILVDVSGYREARRQALAKFTREVAAQVIESGASRVFEPMPAADRKVVHDTVNDIEGVFTTSEGEEPRRRVVILPEVESATDA